MSHAQPVHAQPVQAQPVQAPPAPALHVQERDRLLAALRGLLRRVTLAGRPAAGIATDAAPGAPLRALDNAIAAEALAIPLLRDADPALAAAPLGFLTALAAAGRAAAKGAGDGTALPRAVAVPVGRVAIRASDPKDFRVLTPWHVLTGDLTRGVIEQALRGEEGAGRSVRHSGNLVRLRPGGVAGLLARFGLAPPALDVEDAISDSGVLQEGRGALLFHESALRLRDAPAGTIRYEYRVSADDPVLRLAVTLRPARGIAGARVTTAVDALSEMRPPMRVATRLGATDAALGPDGEGPWPAEADLGAVAGLDILRLRTAGEAEPLSLLLRPRGPAPLRSLRATGRAVEGSDALHWVVLRHDLPATPAGGAATLAEDRLLVRGTPASAPRAMRRLRDPAPGEPLDAGLTDDPALVAAVAGALAAGGAEGGGPETAALRDWLTGAVDAGLAAGGDLHPALVLAAERLWRAGADPAGERLRLAVPRLTTATDGYAMLAAARLSPWSPEAAAALRDGLAARPETPEGLDDLPTTELATLLRGFRAAARAEAVPPDLRGVAAAWAAGCLEALGARLRSREDALEVAPTRDGGPGDALPILALLLGVLGEEGGA